MFNKYKNFFADIDNQKKYAKWIIKHTKGYIKSLLLLTILSSVSVLLSIATALIGKQIIDNAIVGKVKYGNDFYYCYYLLKRLNLNSRHVGSGQPLMTQEILNSIEINICDYETQRKIGKILKNIDDKIVLNNEINNNLCYQS